jgi:hypothetical protein
VTDLCGSGTTQQELDQAEARLAQTMGMDSSSPSPSSSSSLSKRNSDVEARKLSFGGLFKGLANTIVSVGGPILGQILSGAGNQLTQGGAAPVAEEKADTQSEAGTTVGQRSIADLD